MRVVVLGAGLAGLSAAYELTRNGVQVLVLEMDSQVGGLAKSFSKNGFTFDLGPHRFHTKQEDLISHMKGVMGDNLVVRNRKSRIYLFKKFFDYPLRFSNALATMPPVVTLKILIDYLKVKLLNVLSPHPDDSFESWVTNRFGHTLYKIFFGEYTEKTWGIPCDKISADWAAQRISLLSLWDTVVKTLFKFGDTPRTYVSRFYYPAHGGIGEICNTYARLIRDNGGKILLNSPVREIHIEDGSVNGVVYEDNGVMKNVDCDYLFSTVPLTDIISMIKPNPPEELFHHSSELSFRSIMFAQIMVNKDSLSDDHWIYLPEKHILGNRVTEYKNFSVNNAPEGKTVIGVEITCDYDDEIWNMDKAELTRRVISDLHDIEFISMGDVIDSVVNRMKHAYPIYDLDYQDHLNPLKEYLDSLSNLSYFGRNALFRYNNMDHSVDMGLKAARNILGSEVDYRMAATGNQWFG
ncbi:MAG: FAD-dependent oxidoreductase [Candidatus Altiarchaeota archaeon]